MENNLNIFLVEDDENFGSVLKSYLEMNGYNVLWVKDGAVAIPNFLRNKFDLCILDVMLPNMDGFSIARKIKQINPEVPAIFLTAKSLKEDVLEGYKIGADDYITKPFDSEVLLYKIKAIVKRNSDNQNSNALFAIGKYIFDPEYRILQIEGKTSKLSPKESDLLKMLCLHTNKILDRNKALQQIWGEDGYFTARSMDVYISKLRKFLKDDPAIEIENIHGSGFILKINT